MSILIACEESQAVCIEFRKLGFETYSCDILPCSGGHPEWHIQDDAIKIMNSRKWDLMIAHPPCTRLANSGVRWLHKPPKGKTRDQIWKELEQAARFYSSFRNAKISKKAIENPIMHKYAIELIGKIDRQIVQPWYFGEKAFKATGFELFNLPELKPTNKLNPPNRGTQEYKEWSFIHRMPPSPERAKLRSKTFTGIAKAMAKQWGDVLL